MYKSPIYWATFLIIRNQHFPLFPTHFESRIFSDSCLSPVTFTKNEVLWIPLLLWYYKTTMRNISIRTPSLLHEKVPVVKNWFFSFLCYCIDPYNNTYYRYSRNDWYLVQLESLLLIDRRKTPSYPMTTTRIYILSYYLFRASFKEKTTTIMWLSTISSYFIVWIETEYITQIGGSHSSQKSVKTILISAYMELGSVKVLLYPLNPDNSVLQCSCL